MLQVAMHQGACRDTAWQKHDGWIILADVAAQPNNNVFPALSEFLQRMTMLWDILHSIWDILRQISDDIRFHVISEPQPVKFLLDCPGRLAGLLLFTTCTSTLQQGDAKGTIPAPEFTPQHLHMKKQISDSHHGDQGHGTWRCNADGRGH